MSFKLSHVPLMIDTILPILSRSNLKKQERDNTQTASFSFGNIIRLTSDCLVSGYVTNNKLQIADNILIPNVIKQLCLNYFIGNFPCSIDDDKLLQFNEKAKNELIQSSFSILCPGKNTNEPMLSLSHLINLTDLCSRSDSDKNTLQRIPIGCGPTIYFRNTYLSHLLSLTEIADFYKILNRDYINTDYNELIINIINLITNNICVQLLHELILQNDIFYEIYRSTVKTKWVRSYKSFEWFIKQDMFKINVLRKLLVPIVFKHEIPGLVQTFNNKSSNPIFALSLLIFKGKCLKITWLWIYKELEYILSKNKYNICLHKTDLQGICMDILCKIQTLSTEYMKYLNVFETLYLLIEVANLDISYKINNIGNMKEIITELLRSDKYGIIGWKILNMEIDKINIYNNNGDIYQYKNEWISYIETKTGLFKINIVSYLDILKKQKNGNIKHAQIHLEYATLTCYNIRKLSCNKLVKFARFYKKMEKTKLIKPILSKLTH